MPKTKSVTSGWDVKWKKDETDTGVPESVIIISTLMHFSVSALRTCKVSGYFDDRQRHQQVSHDFCEAIPDILWGCSIFQVLIRDKAIDGRSLGQEVKLDHQGGHFLNHWFKSALKWMDEEQIPWWNLPLLD